MGIKVKDKAPILTKEIDKLIAELKDFRSELAATSIPDIDYHHLKNITTEEVRVIQLACQGLTSKEIGVKICKAVRSVDNAKGRILEKVGAKNMTQAVFILCKARILN